MLETKLEKTWMARMFGVVVLIACLAQQSAAAPPCNSSTVWHTDGTYSRCCETIDCAPGTWPNICVTEFTSATCARCPDKRFNNMILSSAPPTGKMESCKPFTTCDPKYQKVVSDGNATHDRICECLNGDLLGADGKCYSPCPPGKYWLKDESRCDPCPEGRFKNTTGGQKCSLCTVCNENATVCSPTNDAVCVQDVNDKASQKSESKLTAGEIVAIVIVPLVVIGVVVLVALCICKRCAKYSPVTKSSETGPENGDVNTSNQASGTTSKGIFSNFCQNFSCCHSHASNSRPSDVIDGDGAGAGDGESHQLIRQNGNSIDPEDNLDQPLGNAGGPNGNLDQPLGNADAQNDNLGQRLVSAAKPEANLDLSSGYAANPGDNLGQRPAPLPASSLCTHVPSAEQSTYQDPHHSFLPHTLYSSPSTLQENHNFNLQSDPSPAAESTIARYISVMQKKNNDVLQVLYLGIYFIGYLFQEDVLTRDQHDDIMLLRDQAGGKEKAFRIIKSALLRSGDKAAKPFLDALVHRDSRQDALAMLIDPERATELISKRDFPDEDLSPEPVKSRNSVEEPGEALLSIGSVDQDIVDYPKPAETVPTETPVKDIDTGEACWVDPAVPASKC